VRLVAVDRAGGAGKSTFARRLAAALPGVELVATDDFAGWDDVLAWWADLESGVLEPLARGEAARFPVHDWRPRRVRGWRSFPRPSVVVLEGVSSARPEVRSRLSLAAFVEAPRDVRLARGLERAGEAARADWEHWMAEEDAHFATAQTEAFSDLVVDGAPPLGHDAEREFVFAKGGCAPF
jgi:uridine kinase